MNATRLKYLFLIYFRYSHLTDITYRMWKSNNKYQPNLNGNGLRVGIVQSRFNEPICICLVSACIEELKQLNVVSEDILCITVPGALEISFALQKLAKSGQFDAFIALGAVIRGETYHFQLVSNESGASITRVALDFGIPIANGVLTTDTDEQAVARITEKGCAAARTAVEMANLVVVLEQLDSEKNKERWA